MLKFEATLGVAAGYGANTGEISPQDAEKIVAKEWQKALEEEFASSNILVGAAVSAARVVYPSGFGCPDTGEVVAVVRGDANPKFVGGEGKPSFADFRDAVIRVAGRVRDALRQERVQLSFMDNSGFVYYEPEDTGGTQRFGDC